jgi:phosphatidylinositol alpha-1,6-mannosyltransferase
MRLKAQALVLTPALDGADGISEVSRQMVSALGGNENGSYVVDVWALDGNSPPDLPASVSRVRTAHGSRARLAGWALARAGASVNELLVVAMHLHLSPLALPLALRGARLAVFLHGIESWQRVRARERAALDRAGVLMANSRVTADRFRTANPEFREADIRVCHLGAPPPTRAPVLPARRNYALIVGRLAASERYKGHDRMIDGWVQVRQAIPSAELVIVGDGDDRARLEALVAEKGLDGAVHFAGRVSAEELDGFYRHAAFFMMPSTGEGFGLAYLEAMREGRACVAAPGAAEEFVEDQVTGRIVDASSTRALVDVTIELFRHPERCASMGQAGAARVRDLFEQRHFEERVRAALTEAIVVA